MGFCSCGLSNEPLFLLTSRSDSFDHPARVFYSLHRSPEREHIPSQRDTTPNYSKTTETFPLLCQMDLFIPARTLLCARV